MSNETKIWIPTHELELLKELNRKTDEEAKNTPWWFRAFLQFKAEKGDYDDMEPAVRARLLRIAYYKEEPEV